MKIITPANPIEVVIEPFARNFYRIKDNEQVWIEGGKSTIFVKKFETHRGYIVIETTDSKKYSVLPKSSKKLLTDSIISNSSLRNIIPNFINGSISLKWKTFSGASTGTKPTNTLELESVISSLVNNINLKQEEIDSEGATKSEGLRAPQIGGIYAILSNVAISREPITVVLPTGTGKSETILGTIVSHKIPRSLIIVPSDGLRNQFFTNCQQWGVLRKINVVSTNALNPIVCKIGSSLKNEVAMENMILGSNLIIATASILNKLSPNILSVLNKNINTVFIDEAHHSSAPTWDNLKTKFTEPKVIQFTATPFREDGKPILGKIVFNYALEDAQKNNFFTKIDFVPVVDYDPDNWDKTIAEKAIELLKKDISDGKDHLLMARVDNIEKAKKIFTDHYEKYTEYNPILITSKSTSSKELIEKLRSGKSKIVVCVNMLGEGIDIPQLKIAALHDIRKSLTVTLQFIGRFTRSNKSKDSAKIVANIADVKIEKKLKQLYKEDADWGKLIAFSSAREIQKKIKFQEVLANFKNSKIPLYNIKPKLSATVFKARDDKWKPEELGKHLEKEEGLSLCDVNEEDGLAIGIYQVDENIDWLDSKVFTESTWELVLLYFDKKNKLLYANSSQKVADITLIQKVINIDFKFEKELPFKCYYGLGHVVLFNLGVDKNTDGPIKYAMYAGSDIFEAISDMEKNKSSKSNAYGLGFKDGEELTLGASKHGKIWSRLIGNIQEWKDWCDEIGRKLSDPEIDVNAIFKGFLQPKQFDESELTAFNDPTSIDFPSLFYQENESVQSIIIDGLPFELNEITLSVSKVSNGYRIEFIYSGGSSSMDLLYKGESFDYVPVDFKKIEYVRKTKTKDFIVYLKSEDAFRIRLMDGTFIENNYHFKPFNPESLFPLDTNLITSNDWERVDISKESRGIIPPFVEDSIQNKIYDVTDKSGRFDIIINDDEPGEVADLLCFGSNDDRLIIEIFHCKYNLKSNPIGSRVKDFYELCGQAQKTVKAVPNLIRLFDHIKTREVKVQKRGGTRFLKGDLKSLELLIKNNSHKRPKIKIILVQPGLKKSAASKDVLELLGSTYTLLKETLNAEFEVLCS